MRQMFRPFVVFAAAAACSAASAAALDVSGFSRCLKMTASAFPDSAVLEGFPALVRLSAAIPGFDYGDFKLADGGDLVFTDTEGNEIPHEIDTWDETGESLVWVRVPLIRGGAVVRCWYGNAAFSRSTSDCDVWSGYKGVWHMSRSGAAAEPDATGGGLDAVPTSSSTDGWNGAAVDTTYMMTAEPGVVGTARRNQEEYAGFVRNRLLVPAYTLGDTFTVSGWFRQKFIYGWHRILTRKEDAGGSGWHVEWDFEGTEQQGTHMTVLGDGNKSVHVDTGCIREKWTHLAFAFSGSSVNVYTNGALCASGEINPVQDTSTPLAIGGSPEGTQTSFEGCYDEVRIGAGAYSAERILAECRTVSDAQFFTYGVVDRVDTSRASVDSESFARCFDIEVSDAAVPAGTVLYDFQALVRISEAIGGFSYSGLAADGSDMVFVDAYGRLLDHEIDTWNVSGESLVWVRVPTYARGTKIRCFYGSASAPSVASSATWTGFGAVWHMNEASPTAAAADSTGNGLDAVATGSIMDRFSCQTGVVGGARRNLEGVEGYDKGRNYWLAPNYDSLGLGGTFTFSGWVKRNSDNREWWERLVSRKAVYTDTDGWEVQQNANYEDKWLFHVSGGSNLSRTATVPPMTRDWVHLAFVFDGTTAICYTNGAHSATMEIAAATDNGLGLAIGSNPTGTEWAYGATYDEMRLCASAASAARVAADYATVKNAASLVYGSAQIPAANPPVLGEAVAVATASGARISFSIQSGKAIRAEVAYTDGEGGVKTQIVSSDEEGLPVPVWFDVSPEGLDADTAYSVSVRAINANGGAVESAVADAIYSGTVSIAKTADASENHLASGSFTVSRASGHAATAFPLTVGLTVSGGDAVSGVDYTAIPATVVIPAGASSATVEVSPLHNAGCQSDRTLSVSLSDGLYAKCGSAATMTIANLAPAKRRDFRKTLEFTVNAAFLGGGTVSGFPALVRLSTRIPGFSYADFGTDDGSDMMFLDEAGNQLAYDVDEWNTSGESLVWVMLPTLSDGAKIRCFYGNGVDPNGGLSAVAWPGYGGVWHMNAASGAEPDATGGGFDAAPAAGANSDISLMVRDGSPGAVGCARINQPYTSDASAVRNALLVPDCDSLGLGGVFTASGWFKATEVKYWERLFSRKTEYSERGGWEVELDNCATAAYVRGGGNNGRLVEIPDLSEGWTSLAFVFDGAKATCYTNGAESASFEVTEVVDNGLPLGIGCDADATESAFAGSYDEVRLWRGAAEPLRAMADYRTVADEAFMSPGEVRDAVAGLLLFLR